VKTGAFQKDVAESMIANISWTTEYSQLKGADLVIEAATEDIGIKRKIFAELEKVCPGSAILASNSSHMEPEIIFEEAQHKNRCLVIHYFFPAERNIVVEIVPGKDTASEVEGFLMRFYEQIGKAPIRVKSRYGYAVDPIFEGIFLAAAFLVEKGLGTVKQVDIMAQRALGLGVGPFTAMNLTGGNPIIQHGLHEMHDKIAPWFKLPAILESQLASGKPWDTPKRGEEVSYSESTYESVSNYLRGAYFGLVCEILDSGIVNLSDLEMAVESALVIKAPFLMMNKMGVNKALELVKAYAKEWPDFSVPEVLVKQAQSGKPWDIPLALREDREEIAVITLRRPTTLNALNSPVMSQIETIFKAIKDDDKIKGAVITGFGTKAFVSGADINELAKIRTPEEGAAISSRGHEILSSIENIGKPVICAMNGLAFGGGNELAMACTARIAKKGLVFLCGQPEPKLGIIPGFGGTQRLPRIVGLENAWPILRTGNPISSQEALKIRLISEEVEGDLKEAGIAFARKVISKAILEGAKMTLEEGLKHEAKSFGECLNTKDMRIGMENFMKFGPKRNAEFSHA